MSEINIIAIVGMTGAGKSVVSDHIVKKGFSFVRFGQITLDIIKERGLSGEDAEKKVREDVRSEHGMAAFAILNIPKINALLESGEKVVVDGLYSWSEYKVLREQYGDRMKVIAVYASPTTRYQRLENRVPPEGEDEALRWRPFTREEAKKRDFAEIENIEKGGPIAIADYTLINEGTLEELYAQVDSVLASCQ